MGTNTISIPHRSKPRTHDGESGVGGFDERRVVLEMDASFARRSGFTQLNEVEYFHALVRHNSSPVMTKNNHRQDVSQNYVDNNPGRKCDNRFGTRVRQVTESRRKPYA